MRQLNFAAPAALAALVLALGTGSSAADGGAPAAARTDTPLIAFDRGGKVWVARPDGSNAHPIANGTDPAWSPDGEAITFEASAAGRTDADIWWSYADGTAVRRIRTHPGEAEGDPDSSADDFQPAWSPMDDFIAFTSNRLRNNDIWLTNSIGHSTGALTRGPADEHSPAWSPDGRRVAFISDAAGVDNVYVIGRDGLNSTRITAGDSRNEDPTWSPDGTKLAYARMTSSSSQIYVVDLASSRPTEVTSDSGIDASPSWSPDGTTIMYTNTDGGVSHLIRVAVSGGKRTAIADDAHNAVWQPWTDLAVSASAAPARRRPTQAVTIRVGLKRGMPASNVRLLITAPLSATIRTSGGTACQAGALAATCHFDSVFSTSARTVTLAVVIRNCRPAKLRVTAASLQPDINSKNNKATLTVRRSC